MQPDKRDKIRALLDSPIEGERAAAKAALHRISDQSPAQKWPWPSDCPPRGSTEWHAGVIEWNKLLGWAISRLGSPCLTDLEIITLRNWARGRGTPWDYGAADFMAIYKKLESAEASAGVWELLGSPRKP